MSERRETPIVRLSSSKALPIDQLNSLFAAIGWNERPEKRWKRVLERSSFVLSAWDGDRIVGMGRILEDGVMCMFYDIGVHPDYQERGVGTKIMNRLIDRVKNEGYASIGLFAWEQNPANIPFYEKFGFKRQISGMELTRHMVRE